MKIRTQAAIGLALVGLSFVFDPFAYRSLRWILLYEHWGEMRELLVAAKFLGSGLGTLVIGLVVAAVDRPRGWRRAGLIWLVFLVTGISAVGLKVVIGRERPSHLDQPPGQERFVLAGPGRGLDAPFQSFPSGHTATSFGTATVIAALYPPAGAVAYAWATCTAVNRVVKHQHFLSDVVAGALLGHLLALWVLRRRARKRNGVEIDSGDDAA